MNQSVFADSFALSLGSVLVKFMSFFLGASSSIFDPSVRSESLLEIEHRCAKIGYRSGRVHDLILLRDPLASTTIRKDPQ